MTEMLRAVVAGHICLDVIPNLDHLPAGKFNQLFQPGHIVLTGPATFSTGGPVSNTGLALHRLGIPTRLVAKVGADPFGQVVYDLVHAHDAALAQGLVIDPAVPTSYSVIVSPPGMDRIFLHCPGANDTFGAEDIDPQVLNQAALFHFGYPPIMRRMYQNGGQELAKVFRCAKSTGVTTSLDMAFPDPSSQAGQVDWRVILEAVLPNVDLFLPSIEELLIMLHPYTYQRLLDTAPEGKLLNAVTPELLSKLAEEMISMGAKVVVLKLGERGLFLRTARQDALSEMGRASLAHLEDWADKTLWAPCFQVNVAGTTGSGDATIAGFLSAVLRGFAPRQALTAAVAVGACNVEAADALSGIQPWEDTLTRIAAGWPRLPLDLSSPNWRWSEESQLWVGPSHSSGKHG